MAFQDIKLLPVGLITAICYFPYYIYAHLFYICIYIDNNVIKPHRHLCADCIEKNVGALTSHNPMGLHGLIQG
jgi:hypothetical protein